MYLIHALYLFIFFHTSSVCKECLIERKHFYFVVIIHIDNVTSYYVCEILTNSSVKLSVLQFVLLLLFVFVVVSWLVTFTVFFFVFLVFYFIFCFLTILWFAKFIDDCGNVWLYLVVIKRFYFSFIMLYLRQCCHVVI